MVVIAILTGPHLEKILHALPFTILDICRSVQQVFSFLVFFFLFFFSYQCKSTPVQV